MNVFASDGILCAANSSIDFAGVEQTSSLRKGLADRARGVLTAVELSSIGPNNWLRFSKSGLKGFFDCIGVAAATNVKIKITTTLKTILPKQENGNVA